MFKRRRPIVLILLVALGAGLAVGVGLCTSPPAANEPVGEVVAGPLSPRAQPPAAATRSATPAPAETELSAQPSTPPGPVGGVEQEAAGTPLGHLASADLPPGPVYVTPYPPRAFQNGPSATESSLVKLLEQVTAKLLSEKSAPPRSVPPPADGVPATSSQADPAAIISFSSPAGAAADPSQNIFPHDPAEGDGQLEMHFNDDNIRDVLEALSQHGGLNILASQNVTGTVSANLVGVDVLSALDAILKTTGYVARREGDFIYVGTSKDFQDLQETLDTVATRVYRPSYVTAAELQTLVEPMLTKEVGVASVSSPAETGIPADDTDAGGNAFAGGDVLLVRDYQGVLDQVDQVVAEIDVRPLQVAIEAMILSVKLDDQNDLGVSWEFLRNNPHIRFGVGSPAGTLPNLATGSGLQFAFLDTNFSTFLAALEEIKDTNVIATPRLTVLNKHRAEIQIGQQQGYVSSTFTETSTSQSVEFLDTGTILRLRPFVSNDGHIRMEIHPELSSGEVKLKGQFTVPEKDLTQVTTNVMVRDGSTVIIGGLIREQLTKNATQVPLLGSLPFIGPAFRSKKKDRTERDEIIVLITPHIISEPEACREGNNAACEFHRRRDVLAEKMSPLGRDHISRRYLRLAQNAWAAGQADDALRFAEMAVHFNPLSRAAIDLRSHIWLGEPYGDHTLLGPAPGATPQPADTAEPIDAWLLDQLEQGTSQPQLQQPAPPHPRDRPTPGTAKDLPRPGSWQ